MLDKLALAVDSVAWKLGAIESRILALGKEKCGFGMSGSLDDLGNNSEPIFRDFSGTGVHAKSSDR